jgi:hypothetical protein
MARPFWMMVCAVQAMMVILQQKRVRAAGVIAARRAAVAWHMAFFPRRSRGQASGAGRRRKGACRFWRRRAGAL